MRRWFESLPLDRKLITMMLAVSTAAVVVAGHVLGLSYGVSAFTGGILCLGLRLMAIRRGWHLPVARPSARGRAETDHSDDEKPR